MKAIKPIIRITAPDSLEPCASLTLDLSSTSGSAGRVWNSTSITVKTGVGMPQLSAVLECADAAHGVGGHIISDGGITCPGDMAKAFGAGGDFVMVGG